VNGYILDPASSVLIKETKFWLTMDLKIVSGIEINYYEYQEQREPLVVTAPPKAGNAFTPLIYLDRRLESLRLVICFF
jgi:hypothetical protein